MAFGNPIWLYMIYLLTLAASYAHGRVGSAVPAAHGTVLLGASTLVVGVWCCLSYVSNHDGCQTEQAQKPK